MNALLTSPPRAPRLRRLSSVELLLAIALLFVAFPFIESLRRAVLIESILLTLVLVSAVFSIATDSRTLIIAVALALPALAGRWIHQFRPHPLSAEIFLIAGSLLVLFVVINLLRSILTAPSVNTEVLCAGISAYLLFALLWTFAYWLVAERVPGAFSFNTTAGDSASIKGFDGLYFSLITLNTVGYGDITPVSKIARMLAVAESTTGVLYVAVLIARLVAMHSTSERNEK